MIDTHLHMVPEVDDGASSIQKSLSMLKMAQEDGVKRWIVTPHLNHPSSVYNYDQLRSAYANWLINHVPKELHRNFIFGVEVYIDDLFMAQIDSISEFPTFENSKYMLVEFSRAVNYETISGAIHELLIRGIVPIVAHVEAYPSLLKSAKRVKALANEGALIQVSAKSITDKKHRKFINELIGLNALDLVASDAHNTSTRSPLLGRAYQIIRRQVSEAYAKRLFIDTPGIVFTGRFYERPEMSFNINRKSILLPSFGFALTMMIMLVMMQPVTKSNSGIAIAIVDENDDQVHEVEVITEEKIATGEAVSINSPNTTESVTESPISNSITTTEPTSGNVTTEPSSQDKPSYEHIVETYMASLTTLQGDYTSNVERIFNEIQNTRNFVADETKRKALIDAYIEEAGRLETKCDYDVYDVLYDFQNALEAAKHPVNIIEEKRAEYHRIKEETKQKYMDAF